MEKQVTLAAGVSYSGAGLHSGKDVTMTLKPGRPDTGIVFIRTDLPEKPEIYGLPADPQTPASINLWKDVVRPVGKMAGVGAIAGVLGLTALTAMRGKGDK